MANQCVKCSKIYASTAPELLKGCSCGSHYFFFFKDDDIKIKENTERLTRDEREEIIHDIKEIISPEFERPIILSLESIRVKKPGKFEIDLVSLFKRKPIVYKIEEGKYIIDIVSTFMLRKEKNKIARKIEKTEIILPEEELEKEIEQKNEKEQEQVKSEELRQH